MQEIKWHIWPGSVYFIESEKELKRAKSKLSDTLYEGLLNMKGDGLTLSTGSTSVIRLKTRCPAVRAHECMHAVFHILRYVGIENTDESDEAFAYSLQYLMRESGKKRKR